MKRFRNFKMTEKYDFSLQDGNGSTFRNETLMSPEGYIAAAVVLFFIGFFGFFFNLFVIILMWKDKQLWTPLNIILLNLVCSDFSVSILGNPWTLASAASHYWLFGKTLCKMYGFFMALLGITSITTLTVLSFERYMLVSQPFRDMKLTRHRAVISVLGIWMYSLSLTTPPLLGWGDYVTEGANISCSVNWEDQTYNTMTYIIFLFIFGLVLPVAIIVFSYANIILTMKQSTIRSGRVTKAEGKVAVMVLVMILAFLVAWTPYAIMALMIQFGNADLVTPALAIIPALVAKSSICYNPIIYVGMNTQYRQSWQQVFNRPKRNEDGLGQSAFTNLTEMKIIARSMSEGSKTIENLRNKQVTTIKADNERNPSI